MKRWRTAAWVLAAVALAEGLALAAFQARGLWQRRAADTAVRRGEAVAARMGCFGCHGPGGAAAINNPGASDGTVPTWTGGTWMMYADNEADVRGWILDGHPAGHKPDAGALIHMPAFRNRLTAAELDDLVAYVLTVSQFGEIPDPQAAAGQNVAVHLGCFGCHGSEGRGLIANPGSFKGYVPPWDGGDYADLVRNDQELRQWVRNGICDRLHANPAARHILETQAIRMPAYGDRVSDKDLAGLRAYIEWVRRHPRGGR
jgi:mono/diheme cytochrome c family protein